MQNQAHITLNGMNKHKNFRILCIALLDSVKTVLNSRTRSVLPLCRQVISHLQTVLAQMLTRNATVFRIFFMQFDISPVVLLKRSLSYLNHCRVRVSYHLCTHHR